MKDRLFFLFIIIFLVLLSCFEVISIESTRSSANYSTQATGFNIAAVGDIGCGSASEGNPKLTLNNIHSHIPELFLALGDLSYQEKSDCFVEMIESIIGINKTKIVIGNHDDGESEDANLTEEYLNAFNLDKLNQGLPYYSFDYQNVHFLALYTHGGRHEKGDDQYRFADEDLEKASLNENIDWIIVFFHKPAYTSFCSPGCRGEERPPHSPFLPIREYHDLFDKYNVTLALQAHNHFYERNFPIERINKDTPKIHKEQNYSYTKTQKVPTIFITVGTGGAPLYSLGDVHPHSVKQLKEFGFLNIDVEGKKITGSFYANNDANGKPRDQFIVSKE